MKVRTKITVAIGDACKDQMKLDGDDYFMSVAGYNVFRHQAKDFRVGDYIEGSFGELNRIVAIESEEYDEAETNPDHAIRDSLPTTTIV